MYVSYYGLRELPFELTTDPRFLWLTPQHREALSSLQYGLSSAKALIVLIGEAGMGKTTVLRAALTSEPCRDVSCVHITNPTLTREDFTRTLANQFDLGARAGESKAMLLHALERILMERRSRGQVTALVVDESQSLSRELFEEVRLLANIETATEKLLPLVLSGQPELADRLDDPSLRQLKQRVTLRCEIRPMTGSDTAGYIASRIKTAGGNAFRLFTREAVAAVHEHSQGIPRLVNVICDNALINGMALRRQPVDREVVLEVCRDLSLKGWPQAQATPGAREGVELAGGDPAQTSAPAPDDDGDEAGQVAPSNGPGQRFALFGRRRL